MVVERGAEHSDTSFLKTDEFEHRQNSGLSRAERPDR